MESFVLNAELRSVEEKVKGLRADRIVPATIYGKNEEPMNIKVGASELLKVARKAEKNHLVDIVVDGKTIKTIIHDYQLGPVTGDFTHVDFRVVSDDTLISAEIPVKLEGNSAALKLGAQLTTPLKKLKVKCLPADLVEYFTADLAILSEVGSNISVKHVNVSDKYRIINPLTEVVASAGKAKAK